MILQINADHPSRYHLEKVAGWLKEGGVIGIPTDCSYSLACLPDNRAAVDRLISLRGLDPSKPLALMFRDLRHVGEYTQFSDQAHRILRRALPGQYCFILEANRRLPRFIGDKRQRVGVRVPNHAVTLAIIEEVGKPLIITTAIDPETDSALVDPWSVDDLFGHGLKIVVDAGDVPGGVSSVVDLSGDDPQVLRKGNGDTSFFED